MARSAQRARTRAVIQASLASGDVTLRQRVLFRTTFTKLKRVLRPDVTLTGFYEHRRDELAIAGMSKELALLLLTILRTKTSARMHTRTGTLAHRTFAYFCVLKHL